MAWSVLPIGSGPPAIPLSSLTLVPPTIEDLVIGLLERRMTGVLVSSRGFRASGLFRANSRERRLNTTPDLVAKGIALLNMVRQKHRIASRGDWYKVRHLVIP